MFSLFNDCVGISRDIKVEFFLPFLVFLKILSGVTVYVMLDKKYKLKYELILGRVSEYCTKYSSATFHAGQRPWGVKADIALPCATQNELSGDEASALVANGVLAIGEGANMPTTPEAIEVIVDSSFLP